MDLKTSLLVNRPSEKGGTTAQRGFSYQNDWAIKELIELHESSLNYAMIIEYQDDIQVVDNVDFPTKISIYQLKTSKAHRFKIGNLLLGGPDKKSVLSKLYMNLLRNEDHIIKAAIVSNCQFECKMADTSISSEDLKSIKLSLLDSKLQDKICSKVDLQVSDKPINNYLDKISLEVGDMPLYHTEPVIINKLVKYFETRDRNSLPDRVTPLFEAMRSEILRKTIYRFEVNSYQDLIKFKSITRSDMDRMLSSESNNNSNLKTLLELASNRLVLEGADLKFERDFKRSYKKYTVDKVTNSSLPFQRVGIEIETLIDDVLSNSPSIKLAELASTVTSQINNKFGFDEAYLSTIVICKFLDDE